jgi:cell division protein FtsI (penicillin-binding protein 3)
MNYASLPQTSSQLALPAWRSRALFVLLLLVMLALFVRAVYLQGIHNDFLQQKGDARYARVIEVPAHRGMITDRNGEPLAISTPVESAWASPAEVEIDLRQLMNLARALDMKPEALRDKLQARRDFVYLKRQLPPEQARKVAALGISGVSLQREYKRYYPAGEVTSHLLGFTDVDDNGREGIELAMQERLGGKPGSQRVIKDRRGQIIEDVGSMHAPKEGGDVALSIDSKLQFLAFREIKQAVIDHKAKSGSVVVLNAKSGEVLALANWPTYNPNNRKGATLSVMRNRAVTDMFEPGSTMKAFTAAAVLEEGKYSPDTRIDTGDGKLTINGRTIHDTHPDGLMTVSQVIQKSSNVGSSKMALSMTPQTFWGHLSDSGFGMRTGSGFPGEASGILRNFKTWRPIEQATMSYGNGISVSLLQLARAYTVFANDGELKPISMVRQTGHTVGEPVYSPRTARAVRDMLELVVKPGGTAPLAQIRGYRVAGKTGTAHKLQNGRYVNEYVASFVGMAPASDPRLIVAVMVDEPSGAEYYGGLVAAPVFNNVMSASLRALDVPYDAPLNNVLQSTQLVGEET